MSKDEKILKYHQLAIPVDENRSEWNSVTLVDMYNEIFVPSNSILGYVLNGVPVDPRFVVIVTGYFADESSASTNYLFIRVRLLHEHVNDGSNHTNSSFIAYHDQVIQIPIIENINNTEIATEVKQSHLFHLNSEMYEQIGWNDTILSLEIATNLPTSFPINIAFDPAPIDKSMGVIYAAIILLSLYVFIIWEIIDRTFAAMLASTMSIAVLALMNERPTMPEILCWIDVHTLLLLFGMMILVGILSETGLFDYLAVYAFKVLNEFVNVSILFINFDISFDLNR